ncbi:MAG: hypothetical protein NZ533_12525, partial [Casimicrobiaceae bacterium]|nr:hypothetical protein [Casimicrobiaceae bacterium]
FININGTIKVVEFLKSYGQISFAYYKIIEGFDYLMLLNLDSGNYIIIETDEDIDANQDKIRFANFPTWSESRATSSSPQILIK